MADENPIGDQAKKHSPAKQTSTTPKPKDAAPAGGAPTGATSKSNQSGGVAKSGGSGNTPRSQSAKQGKPAADQPARDEAKTAPRTPSLAPRPASLAKPGSGPGNSHPADARPGSCLLYTSPSPRDRQKSRMPSSA